jgi:hypothetical protein
VTIERTLVRVEEDLRAGRSQLAVQRMRSLIGSFPQRLDFRERIAELYRAQGNLAQAGRWSYLAEVRDPREEEAFHKAFGRDPARMMRALAWRGSEDDAATTIAQELLRLLSGKGPRRRLGTSSRGRTRTGRRLPVRGATWLSRSGYSPSSPHCSASWSSASSP